MSSCFAVAANGIWFVTVPESANTAQLVPEIVVSEGASVKVDGLPYEAGKAYDFSGSEHSVTVSSESGARTVDYRICIKSGDAFVDNRIYEFMRDFSIPGVAVAIMKRTEIAYATGCGFAVQESNEMCTADHLFRIGNISRVFCTMCIMSLKEEGRLNLDEVVFGENGILKNLKLTVTPYHESITVRHLLSCSSGLCKGLGDPCFTDSFRFYDNVAPVPADTLIQRVLAARPQPFDDGSMIWSAGAGYDDSNLDYCILHRVVEIVSGKDYESYLKQDVLSKMGIMDTHIGDYAQDRRQNECAYYGKDGLDAYTVPLRETAGALGIISSAKQLMTVLAFMDRDDTVPDIFSEETQDEMYSPYGYTGSGEYGKSFKRFGLGWKLNHPGFFKGSHYCDGDMPGTVAILVGGTDHSMSGVLLCNSNAYHSNGNGDIKDNLEIMLNDFLRQYE